MKVVVFDTHRYDRLAMTTANVDFGHELHFLEVRLNASTASLATGYQAVCSFVNDHIDRSTLEVLSQVGVKFIALRSAGFNHVDLKAARELGISIARVPEYSPHAVAEHAIAMILMLNRKLHRAYNRVRELNFSLDGLVGFDLFNKTVGIVGTGRIGRVMAQIMRGFGCKILAYDIEPDQQFAKMVGIEYVSLNKLFAGSDIVSLHVPLKPDTKHIINDSSIETMKKGVMVINTGRGGLIDTKSLVSALKRGKIGYAGLDVYEEEEGIFFEDLSELGLQDDALARLLTFPNVLITSHQAFLTHEALSNIAKTTLANLEEFAKGRRLTNEVSVQ